MTTFKIRGIHFALLSGVIWSLFPVITTLSFTTIPALWAAAIGTAFSTIYFLGVLVVRGQWKRSVSRECRQQILTACLLIGVGYYTALYIGIHLTTPGNAAIVSLMEIFFSYLFISIIGKHEAFNARHVLGAAFMVAGSLFILVPSVTGGVHAGDVIIFFGSMLPPLGNLAMQRARKEVSAAFIMFWRSLVGSAFLMMFAYVWQGPLHFGELRSSLPVLLLTGFVVLGFSKILWIEAIHRLPITQTLSIAAIQPILTMLFALLILGSKPQLMQFLSLPPMIIGMVLLMKKDASFKTALEEV
jgi:drug/metabolite transporter (DMT)-like permease